MGWARDTVRRREGRRAARAVGRQSSSACACACTPQCSRAGAHQRGSAGGVGAGAACAGVFDAQRVVSRAVPNHVSPTQGGLRKGKEQGSKWEAAHARVCRAAAPPRSHVRGLPISWRTTASSSALVDQPAAFQLSPPFGPPRRAGCAHLKTRLLSACWMPGRWASLEGRPAATSRCCHCRVQGPAARGGARTRVCCEGVSPSANAPCCIRRLCSATRPPPRVCPPHARLTGASAPTASSPAHGPPEIAPRRWG